MAYEFQKLGEVTEVEEVSDGANVLIEEDGEIKRAPKGLVGGGGIPRVVVDVSQVISQEPITIQFTDAQWDIVSNSALFQLTFPGIGTFMEFASYLPDRTVFGAAGLAPSGDGTVVISVLEYDSTTKQAQVTNQIYLPA